MIKGSDNIHAALEKIAEDSVKTDTGEQTQTSRADKEYAQSKDLGNRRGRRTEKEVRLSPPRTKEYGDLVRNQEIVNRKRFKAGKPDHSGLLEASGAITDEVRTKAVGLLNKKKAANQGLSDRDTRRLNILNRGTHGASDKPNRIGGKALRALRRDEPKYFPRLHSGATAPGLSLQGSLSDRLISRGRDYTGWPGKGK